MEENRGPATLTAKYEHVANIFKAFQGHLFGPYVRFEVMGDLPNAIDVHMEPTLFPSLFNVLNLSYATTITTMKPLRVSLCLNPGTDNINITVWLMSADMMSHQNVFFDADALASSLYSIYVRPLMLAREFSSRARLAEMLSRLRTKRFALVAPVQPGSDESVFETTMKAMLDAENMVYHGWVMDDHYIGRNSWVINLWSTFETEYIKIRTCQNKTECHSFHEQSMCSLCHEYFKASDVVLSTCCNHNFHWKCQPLGMDGIMYWFQLKQAFDCPCCRRSAVNGTGVASSSATGNTTTTAANTTWSYAPTTWNVDMDPLPSLTGLSSFTTSTQAAAQAAASIGSVMFPTTSTDATEPSASSTSDMAMAGSTTVLLRPLTRSTIENILSSLPPLTAATPGASNLTGTGIATDRLSRTPGGSHHVRRYYTQPVTTSASTSAASNSIAASSAAASFLRRNRGHGAAASTSTSNNNVRRI